MEPTTDHIFIVIKGINGRSVSLLSFMYASVTNTLGCLLQQFKTYDHFSNLISLSGQSHILENTTSIAHG